MPNFVQEPPVYDSNETMGMQGWFQTLYNYVRRANRVHTASADYTVEDSVFHVRTDATAGTVSITIPQAAGRGGRQILVTKIDGSANAVSVLPSGTDTFEGGGSISLGSQWEKALVISNNNNGWERII